MADKSIQTALEQDARLISERIPMSASKASARKMIVALRALMEEMGWTQTKVADMLGVSHSLISQFLRGKYKGSLETIVNKVTNLINSTARKERRVRPKQYVETTVAKRIGALVAQTESFSDDEGKIGLIIGDGGHGKSHCLRQYAEANKNTVYVELDQAMYSTLIFAEIAKSLGIDSSGSLATVTRRLIEHLQNRCIVVMLDEASNLKVKQLDQIRQVIVVKARCPLILAGNGDLLKTVMQPTTRRGFESLDQFTSRLMAILDLNAAAGDKDGGLYSAEDIRKLYEYGGIRLASDAVATMRRICRTPRSGRFRTCSLIIAALHTAGAVTERGTIDAALIMAAIEQLGLPVKVWLPMTFREEIEEEKQEAAAKAG